MIYGNSGLYWNEFMHIYMYIIYLATILLLNTKCVPTYLIKLKLISIRYITKVHIFHKYN